jgi:hypothetical protein
LSFRRFSSSRNTMAPSLERSSVPSSFKTSGPNVDTILLSVRVPGRTTSRARMSASITGILRAASCLETVDFPVAMPPVRPMTIAWLEKLEIARGQCAHTQHPWLRRRSSGTPFPARPLAAVSHAPSPSTPTCPSPSNMSQRSMASMARQRNRREQNHAINSDAKRPSRRKLQHRYVIDHTFSPAHYRRDAKAAPDVNVKKEDDVQEIENVEYVSEQLDLKGAALEAFSDVFARFQFESEDSPVRRAYESLTSPYHTFLLGKIRGPAQRRGHLLGR